LTLTRLLPVDPLQGPH